MRLVFGFRPRSIGKMRSLLPILGDCLEAGEDCGSRFGCGEGSSGFFDDFWWGAGVWAFGELVGGEEFGVATGAVAGTQEVEEALLADAYGGGGGWVRWRSGVCGFGGRRLSGFFGALCSLRMTTLVRVSGSGLRGGFGFGAGSAALTGRGFERAHGDLEAVDHLAGAAGVDGVLREAVDDGGEGDEDAGAVLDGRNLHAGDFRVDEEGPIAAGGVLDDVVVAVILALECGRAATLSGWSLVVEALLIAAEVWNWLRHGVPPWVSISA